MTFKKLLTEERAVSPVIGVILMVAITVILAAVIGTFVIGLGDGVGDTAPQASVDVDSGNDSSINFTHRSGDSIPADEAFIVGNSSSLAPNSTGVSVNEDGRIQLDDDLSAGDSITVVFNESSSGDTISLVYDDGDQSATLKSGEVE